MRFLDDFGDLGPVDRPGQFFWGTLPLRWGPFGEESPSLVYFGGATDHTVVGLGGSAYNVLGAPPVGKGRSGLRPSMTPALIAGLGRSLLGDGGDALAMVREATEEMRGPAQNVEFVAKRLLHGVVRDRWVLLGSPLYVALVD